MKKFPEFFCNTANRVHPDDAPGEGMEGFVFEGADGVQIVFWQSEKGGTVPPHSHDYWEYALVVAGRFEGRVGDKAVSLGPGDELVVPPGVVHEGRHSAGYRAVDAFQARRVRRCEG